MESYNYERTIKAIIDECEKINISYSTEGDGRITSAVKETEYLDKLNKGLRENHPSILFEYPPTHRWWWDCKIDGIPINLKLTTGGTDNVFNKVAIIYSISGKEPAVKSMNFNTFFQKIKAGVRKNERNVTTEYHYLVVNKNTGKILLKSINTLEEYSTRGLGNTLFFKRIASLFSMQNILNVSICFFIDPSCDKVVLLNKREYNFKE